MMELSILGPVPHLRVVRFAGAPDEVADFLYPEVGGRSAEVRVKPLHAQISHQSIVESQQYIGCKPALRIRLRSVPLPPKRLVERPAPVEQVALPEFLPQLLALRQSTGASGSSLRRRASDTRSDWSGSGRSSNRSCRSVNRRTGQRAATNRECGDPSAGTTGLPPMSGVMSAESPHPIPVPPRVRWVLSQHRGRT